MTLVKGRQGYAPTEQIQLSFARAFKAAGRPCEMAVFTESSIDAPEVKLYFSPAVSRLATQFDATPCEQPSSQRLGLFAGDQRSWDFFFDDVDAHFTLPTCPMRHARPGRAAASP
jgi:hypothetical protein